MTFAIESGAEPLIAPDQVQGSHSRSGLCDGRIEPHRTTQVLSAVQASSPDRIRSTTATTNGRRLESERRNGILFDKDNNSAIDLAPIVIEPSA